MWEHYYSAFQIDEVLTQLAEQQPAARVVAGATDLILEMERGTRTGIHTLIDISRIPGLDTISIDDEGVIHLGALVTHNACAASSLLQQRALPLAQACWSVGSPQIRNRGTIAGNVITASPANDTITPLMALGARVRLRSLRGERIVTLNDFYLGVRRTVMAPDEMLVEIEFPALPSNSRGIYVKNALRKAQAISVVNLAMVITFDGERIAHATLTAGAVAPTIIHLPSAEGYLAGKTLTAEVITKAGELAGEDVRPISDIRSTANYRAHITAVLARRALERLSKAPAESGVPAQPIQLKTAFSQPAFRSGLLDGRPISTSINGKLYEFSSGRGKTLARLLREEAGLMGTKIGCGEGECGACTIIMDGMAVMSCLVPAERADGAEILTVEGLVQPDGGLHPMQQAFIDEGAVQCGYCTPGFLMSSVKLLEEKAHPSYEEIQQAISGNLCRCTGYYKIISAVEKAAAAR